MKYVIDRIEENLAVVETEEGKTATISLDLIENAKEGDAVVITIEKKSDETAKNTHSIFEKLRNKSK